MFLILVLVIFGLGILQSARFGSSPSGKFLKALEKSVQFNNETNRFENLEQMGNKIELVKLLTDSFSKENLAPGFELPFIETNINEFKKGTDEFKFVWLGHSSFLINFSGKIILYDPVFSSSVSPIYFLGKRFQPTPISLEELPPIDYIILSHDHYDHLDIDSITHFQDSNTVFFTPLGVGSHLRSWGIEENRITELDWWESAKVGELEFILTPAKHFSGRVGFDKNKTLWGSWIMKGSNQKYFFSGDSGYGDHFKQIGSKYGPFDLTFMENGQYNPMWTAVHMLPSHTVKAQRDLKSKRMVPMHWGMFTLSTHTWFDPVQSLGREAKKFNLELIVPKLGEIISVSPSINIENWWQELIPKS